MVRVRARWRWIVLGFAIALPVAFVAAELTLRLVGFDLPVPAHAGDRENGVSRFYEADPVLGWRLHPERVLEKPDPSGRRIEYRSDAEGFRCGSGPSAAGDAPLLAVVGASFPFGWDVAYEEAFGTLAAERLGWRHGNLAMPGFGLDQTWLVLRTRALARKPALVVLALYLGDFERSRTAYRASAGFTKPHFLLIDGKLVPETPADAPGDVGRWIESTRVARFLDSALRHAGRFVEVGPWWSLNAAILSEMRDDCAAAGVPLLVLFLPDARWRSFPALGRHLERMHVPCIDPIALTPRKPPGLFFEANAGSPHLTAVGHRFLADLLEAWCRENLGERSGR